MYQKSERSSAGFPATARDSARISIEPTDTVTSAHGSSCPSGFRDGPNRPSLARARDVHRSTPSVRSWDRLRRGTEPLRVLLADETGSATAEYAVATMAAVGFAGLLVLILRGDEVRGILTDLVRRALTVAN